MKKNLRKIPDFISNKLNEIESNYIEVASIIQVKESEINNIKFKNLGFQSCGDEITFPRSFVPNKMNGTFSKRNIDGYKIRHKDKAKIYKNFYLGERPFFGDWSKGSFSMYANRKVFPSEFIAPQELSISIELIKQVSDVHFLKVAIDKVFDRNEEGFSEGLFFALNLLQENIYTINVFASQSSVEEYLKTLLLNWEIFPLGEREVDLERILKKMRNPYQQKIEQIENRYDFLKSLRPLVLMEGLSGIRNYFGAKFSDNLVVFENMNYGNAIYVLFENWEELSRLSRTELQSRPSDQYIRIKHHKNWEEKVRQIILNRRDSNSESN